MLRVLGPVRADTPAGTVEVGGPMERRLVASLAASRNQVISVDRLIDALWGEAPPRTAVHTLRAYVGRVRKALATSGVELRTTSPGYVLNCPPGTVDADIAQQALEAARACAEDERRLSLLDDALALWRGDPLVDAGGVAFVDAEAVRLRELREEAVDARLATLLDLGRFGDAIGDAEAALASEPLRERRWEVLLVALYRSGRQSEALRAYQRVRTILGEELGIEPGPALRRLESAIIAQEPDLTLATGAAGAGAGAPSTVTTTATFVLTDVEGSTRRWERDPDGMSELLARHDAVVGAVVERHGGDLVKTKGEGDSTFSVFADPVGAVAAGLDLQREVPLPIRVSVHTGVVERRDGDWYGPSVNRAARLRALAQGGQVLLSAATAALVAGALPDGATLRDLGPLQLKDIEQAERVHQLVHPALRDDIPAPTATGVRTNVGADTKRFIGRSSDLARVASLVAEARLVTLTGPGGSGKTTLARRVALDLLGRHADGVWLAELAPVDADQVATAVASTLRVAETPGVALTDVIADHIGSQHQLLVLDNCEHVVEAAAALVEHLLARCPSLRVLATSRERLGLAGEATWPVQPLGLPSDDHDADAESVVLFADRAAKANPSFALDEATLPAVAQICTRLDGIPLAIELAAARTRLLPADQIARHLDDRFTLLRSGDRGLLPRQQTLLALVQWSDDLLEHEERRLFHRLSVFRGGFDLAAAAEVCSDVPGDELALLDVLGQLVDKSLVQTSGDGRFHLLETLREFGALQLDAAEAGAVADRHTRWVERLVQALRMQSAGPALAKAIATVRRERENIAAALRRVIDAGDAAAAARLGAGLWKFWYLSAAAAEGQAWLDQIAALGPDGAEPADRADVLLGAAYLGHLSRQGPPGEPLLEEALAIGRAIPSARIESQALDFLGEIRLPVDREEGRALYQQALEAAEAGGAIQEASIARLHLAWSTYDDAERIALLERVLADARAVDDRWLVSVVSQALLYHVEGERKERLIAEALEIAREMDDLSVLAGLLAAQAADAAAHGDAATVARLLDESIATSRHLGNVHALPNHLFDAGLTALAVGDHDRARRWATEALELIRERDNREGLAACTLVLAMLANSEERFDDAVPLLLEALEHAAALGNPYMIVIAGRTAAALAAQRGDLDVAARLISLVDADELRGAYGPLPLEYELDERDHQTVASRVGALPPPAKGASVESLAEETLSWLSATTRPTPPGGDAAGAQPAASPGR